MTFGLKTILLIYLFVMAAFVAPATAADQIALNDPTLESIHTGALYPEGIEYNPKTGKFLLCSFREGVVYEVSSDGTYRRLIEDERLITGMGIRVDVARNRLLVVTADVDISVRRSAKGPNTFAALGIYDLSTGKPTHFINLGSLRPEGEKHTRVFSGRVARGIVNDFVRRMAPFETNAPEYPVQNWLTQPIRKAAALAKDADALSLWAGQAAPLTKRTSAAELMLRLIQETVASRQHP